MFFDDPEGYFTFKDYVDKLIDNLYQFSKNENNKRKVYKVVFKIVQRRKLQKKIRFMMPGYNDRLKGWEKDQLDQYNISERDIKMSPGKDKSEKVIPNGEPGIAQNGL